MNQLIIVDDQGIIDIAEYDTADRAIENARKIISKVSDDTLHALQINFSDGTTAVWNEVQKSDILLPKDHSDVYIRFYRKMIEYKLKFSMKVYFNGVVVCETILDELPYGFKVSPKYEITP